jgi:alkanesulfonate monooxygenase SsuD/methylene tetrahydromethanopterin reductase-like flavin-dependent oxidoreductase (luciferase family)
MTSTDKNGDRDRQPCALAGGDVAMSRRLPDSSPMTRCFLRFDMRAPAFGADRRRLYQEALSMVAWADERGFSAVRLSEHHGVEDGYLPTPITLACAMAARSRRCRLSLAAIVLPLHDPVVIAEQIAVLDLVSGGRVDATLGAGYVPSELAMFAVEPKSRGRLLEEKLEVLRQAWTGEWFEHHGRRVRVRPTPVQTPYPPLSLGGSTPTAARRAARLGCGFDTHLPELYQVYADAARELGREPDAWHPFGPTFMHVTHDPDAAWRVIAPHALHETNSYGRWAAETGLDSSYVTMTDEAELRRVGNYAVVTPEGCLEIARSLGPDGVLIFHPLMGGLDPDFSWASLELFAAEVWPQLR